MRGVQRRTTKANVESDRGRSCRMVHGPTVRRQREESLTITALVKLVRHGPLDKAFRKPIHESLGFGAELGRDLGLD